MIPHQAIWWKYALASTRQLGQLISPIILSKSASGARTLMLASLEPGLCMTWHCNCFHWEEGYLCGFFACVRICGFEHELWCNHHLTLAKDTMSLKQVIGAKESNRGPTKKIVLQGQGFELRPIPPFFMRVTSVLTALDMQNPTQTRNLGGCCTQQPVLPTASTDHLSDCPWIWASANRTGNKPNSIQLSAECP